MAENDSHQSKKKSFWADLAKLILFLGIGFAFIYFFLLKLSPEQKSSIWDSFLHANYFWVIAVMVCVTIAHFIRALRWLLLYKPMGLKPGLNNTFGAVIVTYMANLAFPRLGEVLRCALLKNSDNVPIEKSLGTVVTERCFDVLAFGVVVVIGMLAMYGQAKEWLFEALSQKISSLPSLGLVTAILVAIIAVSIICYRLLRDRMLKFALFRKIDSIIQGALDGLKSIFHLGTRNTILFIIYSALIYLFYILGGVVILQAFPETQALGFGAAFVLYLFGSVGMTISQGGLGAYPVLVWQALSLYGIGETIGLAEGWLLWSSQQVIVILLGLAYLVYFSLIKKKVNTIE